MRSSLRYLAAALLPLCVLLWLPLEPICVLTWGREICLAARPIDPRDPFRGDYVALEMDAASVPDAAFRPAFELSAFGRECFVTLAPEPSGLWGPSLVTLTEPEDGVYLRGRIDFRKVGSMVHVDLGDGLRRFYVPEGTGQALERAARDGKNYRATVRILRGRAVIVSLDVAP